MFSLAGLWERWEKGEEPIETFTVLTITASAALAKVHHRQPVIVEDARADEWLDPTAPEARVIELARAACEGPYDVRPVSRAVNNARHNAPELLRSVDV